MFKAKLKKYALQIISNITYKLQPITDHNVPDKNWVYYVILLDYTV